MPEDRVWHHRTWWAVTSQRGERGKTLFPAVGLMPREHMGLLKHCWGCVALSLQVIVPVGVSRELQGQATIVPSSVRSFICVGRERHVLFICAGATGAFGAAWCHTEPSLSRGLAHQLRWHPGCGKEPMAAGWPRNMDTGGCAKWGI